MNTPYSDKVFQIIIELEHAESYVDRVALLMELASQFSKDHDSTMTDLPEKYHKLFEDYQTARLRFQQTALRLGRLALAEVNNFKKDNPSGTN